MEISDAVWFAAKKLAESRITNSSEENINNYLMSTGNKVSDSSVSFDKSNIEPMLNFMDKNIKTPRLYVDKGGKKLRCLGQVCRGASVLYDTNLDWRTAINMDVPGNVKGKNNMNKSMQHLINLGLASNSQIQVPEKINVSQTLYDRTTPNSYSLWGISLNNSYHSLNIVIDRTGRGFKGHYIDQNAHYIFKSPTALDNYLNKYSGMLKYPTNHTFTQYKQ